MAPNNEDAANQVITFLQANIMHSKVATATLRRRLEASKLTVALIQEPYHYHGRVCGLGNLGGNLFTDANVDTPPRTCIYVSGDMKANIERRFCSRDLTTVRLLGDPKRNAPDILISSVYMAEGEQVPPTLMEQLIRHCEDREQHLLIAADANAHHTVWGSRKNNVRGENMVEFLCSTVMCVINRGAEPTFVTKRFQTIPDITLATQNLARHITGWQVSKEPSCSDHRRIEFRYEGAPLRPELRRNPRTTNKRQYYSNLKSRLDVLTAPGRITTTEQVEVWNDTVSTSIIESYHESCPLRDTHRFNPKHSWWTAKLEKVRRTVRRAFNKAKDTRLDTDWEAYKATLMKYKNKIRDRERKAWRDFCSSIESTAETARLKKILSADKNKELGSVRRSDNTLTESVEEAYRVLLETHFPGSVIVSEVRWDNSPDHEPTTQDWEVADKVISDDKVQWAISSFHPYKSAGCDGILPGLLQWSRNLITPFLVDILKTCLAHRYVPRAWREVRVVFIPKPGREDYSAAKAYRPISLTSFLLKTLERLI